MSSHGDGLSPTHAPDPYWFDIPQSGMKTAEERRKWIAEAAYFMAERRGFAPGHELSDWLAAEAEANRVWA